MDQLFNAVASSPLAVQSILGAKVALLTGLCWQVPDGLTAQQYEARRAEYMPIDCVVFLSRDIAIVASQSFQRCRDVLSLWCPRFIFWPSGTEEKGSRCEEEEGLWQGWRARFRVALNAVLRRCARKGRGEASHARTRRAVFLWSSCRETSTRPCVEEKKATNRRPCDPAKVRSGEIAMKDVPYMQRGGSWKNNDVVGKKGWQTTGFGAPQPRFVCALLYLSLSLSRKTKRKMRARPHKRERERRGREGNEA